MRKKCYAKINLILDVVEKRTDGYHNIDGIMQLIDLYDYVDVEIADEFKITSNSKNIPLDENNIVYRVYEIMKEKYNFKEKFLIHIEKNIPISAGIAGGSTNAAAVIELIDEILNLNLSLEEKKDVGKLVGADVPFLLTKKTSRTRGIGEVIEELDNIDETKILIVNNGVEVSTPYVYKNIVPSGKNDRVDRLVKLYKEKRYDEFFDGIFNVMEKVSIEYCPQIKDIKEKMMKFNCKKSLMSGSGPTVFGIFESDEDLQKAYEYFKEIYKNTFKTKTIEV